MGENEDLGASRDVGKAATWEQHAVAAASQEESTKKPAAAVSPPA